MRLTTFTDYNLRVLIYLAVQPDKRATIAEIAAAFEVSESHLMKVVHSLGKHGFLANVRGKGGGLMLARPPEDINVGAIVQLTEADALLAECFNEEHNACVITRACQLRKVLGEAAKAFNDVLSQYTVADLISERSRLARILSIPIDAVGRR
jgi:Rrf2 family nitric oxide-sensitive transcriptional repressor